jgi:hypothetical protein
MGRLNFGNTSYFSVQKLPFSRQVSKNIKIKTQETICLSVVLHMCKILSLTLRKNTESKFWEQSVEDDIWTEKG